MRTGEKCEDTYDVALALVGKHSARLIFSYSLRGHCQGPGADLRGFQGARGIPPGSPETYQSPSLNRKTEILPKWLVNGLQLCLETPECPPESPSGGVLITAKGIRISNCNPEPLTTSLDPSLPKTWLDSGARRRHLPN